MDDLSIYNPDRLQSMLSFAEKLAGSQLIPYALKGKPQDILVILQTGHELGLPPMQSLNSIDVIQGRPSLRTQTQIALIRSKFPDALIRVEKKGNDTICTMGRHQDDKNTFTSIWNINRAQLMGLTGRDQWKKQPEVMLQWRAMGECARIVFPDVIMNLYTPDEVLDIKPEAPIEAKKSVHVKSSVLEPKKAEVLDGPKPVKEVPTTTLKRPVIKKVEPIVEPKNGSPVAQRQEMIQMILERLSEKTTGQTNAKKKEVLQMFCGADSFEEVKNFSNEVLANICETMSA